MSNKLHVVKNGNTDLEVANLWLLSRSTNKKVTLNSIIVAETFKEAWLYAPSVVCQLPSMFYDLSDNESITYRRIHIDELASVYIPRLISEDSTNPNSESIMDVCIKYFASVHSGPGLVTSWISEI